MRKSFELICSRRRLFVFLNTPKSTCMRKNIYLTSIKLRLYTTSPQKLFIFLIFTQFLICFFLSLWDKSFSNSRIVKYINIPIRLMLRFIKINNGQQCRMYSQKLLYRLLIWIWSNEFDFRRSMRVFRIDVTSDTRIYVLSWSKITWWYFM